MWEKGRKWYIVVGQMSASVQNQIHSFVRHSVTRQLKRKYIINI